MLFDLVTALWQLLAMGHVTAATGSLDRLQAGSAAIGIACTGGVG